MVERARSLHPERAMQHTVEEIRVIERHLRLRLAQWLEVQS